MPMLEKPGRTKENQGKLGKNRGKPGRTEENQRKLREEFDKNCNVEATLGCMLKEASSVLVLLATALCP